MIYRNILVGDLRGEILFEKTESSEKGWVLRGIAYNDPINERAETCGCPQCLMSFEKVPIEDLPLYLHWNHKTPRFFELLQA
jgi:hypothetical protein